MKLRRREIIGQPMQSRPARGAWIETELEQQIDHRSNVAPRTGRVD